MTVERQGTGTPTAILDERPSESSIRKWNGLGIRGIRDNVRTYVQNEIQGTNRRGVPASVAGTKDPEGGRPLRRHALDSAQATDIGISRRQGVLGHLSALSGSIDRKSVV